MYTHLRHLMSSDVCNWSRFGSDVTILSPNGFYMFNHGDIDDERDESEDISLSPPLLPQEQQQQQQQQERSQDEEKKDDSENINSALRVEDDQQIFKQIIDDVINVPHSSYITIEGQQVHKAHAINKYINDKHALPPSSSDRLKRVANQPKYIPQEYTSPLPRRSLLISDSESQNRINHEPLLLVDEGIVAVIAESSVHRVLSLLLCQILSIKIGSAQVDCLPATKLNDSNVSLILAPMEFVPHDHGYVWVTTTHGDKLKITTLGTCAVSINRQVIYPINQFPSYNSVSDYHRPRLPECSYNITSQSIKDTYLLLTDGEDDYQKLKPHFKSAPQVDLSYFPYDAHRIPRVNVVYDGDDSYPCYVCGKHEKLLHMRHHVGVHIINEDRMNGERDSLTSPCGCVVDVMHDVMLVLSHANQ